MLRYRSANHASSYASAVLSTSSHHDRLRAQFLLLPWQPPRRPSSLHSLSTSELSSGSIGQGTLGGLSNRTFTSIAHPPPDPVAGRPNDIRDEIPANNDNHGAETNIKDDENIPPERRHFQEPFKVPPGYMSARSRPLPWGWPMPTALALGKLSAQPFLTSPVAADMYPKVLLETLATKDIAFTELQSLFSQLLGQTGSTPTPSPASSEHASPLPSSSGNTQREIDSTRILKPQSDHPRKQQREHGHFAFFDCPHNATKPLPPWYNLDGMKGGNKEELLEGAKNTTMISQSPNRFVTNPQCPGLAYPFSWVPPFNSSAILASSPVRADQVDEKDIKTDDGSMVDPVVAQLALIDAPGWLSVPAASPATAPRRGHNEAEGVLATMIGMKDLKEAALVLLANWDLVRDQSLIDSVITMVLRTDHHLAISLSHLTLTSRLQLAAAIYSRIRTPSPLRPHGVLPSVRTYMLLLSTIAVADDSETMLAFAQVLYTDFIQSLNEYQRIALLRMNPPSETNPSSPSPLTPSSPTTESSSSYHLNEATIGASISSIRDKYLSSVLAHAHQSPTELTQTTDTPIREPLPNEPSTSTTPTTPFKSFSHPGQSSSSSSIASSSTLPAQASLLTDTIPDTVLTSFAHLSLIKADAFALFSFIIHRCADAHSIPVISPVTTSTPVDKDRRRRALYVNDKTFSAVPWSKDSTNPIESQVSARRRRLNTEAQGDKGTSLGDNNANDDQGKNDIDDDDDEGDSGILDSDLLSTLTRLESPTSPLLPRGNEYSTHPACPSAQLVSPSLPHSSTAIISPLSTLITQLPSHPTRALRHLSSVYLHAYVMEHFALTMNPLSAIILKHTSHLPSHNLDKPSLFTSLFNARCLATAEEAVNALRHSSYPPDRHTLTTTHASTQTASPPSTASQTGLPTTTKSSSSPSPSPSSSSSPLPSSPPLDLASTLHRGGWHLLTTAMSRNNISGPLDGTRWQNTLHEGQENVTNLTPLNYLRLGASGLSSLSGSAALSPLILNLFLAERAREGDFEAISDIVDALLDDSDGFHLPINVATIEILVAYVALACSSPSTHALLKSHAHTSKVTDDHITEQSPRSRHGCHSTETMACVPPSPVLATHAVLTLLHATTLQTKYEQMRLLHYMDRAKVLIERVLTQQQQQQQQHQHQHQQYHQSRIHKGSHHHHHYHHHHQYHPHQQQQQQQQQQQRYPSQPQQTPHEQPVQLTPALGEAAIHMLAQQLMTAAAAGAVPENHMIPSKGELLVRDYSNPSVFGFVPPSELHVPLVDPAKDAMTSRYSAIGIKVVPLDQVGEEVGGGESDSSLSLHPLVGLIEKIRQVIVQRKHQATLPMIQVLLRLCNREGYLEGELRCLQLMDHMESAFTTDDTSSGMFFPKPGELSLASPRPLSKLIMDHVLHATSDAIHATLPSSLTGKVDPTINILHDQSRTSPSRTDELNKGWRSNENSDSGSSVDVTKQKAVLVSHATPLTLASLLEQYHGDHEQNQMSHDPCLLNEKKEHSTRKLLSPRDMTGWSTEQSQRSPTSGRARNTLASRSVTSLSMPEHTSTESKSTLSDTSSSDQASPTSHARSHPNPSNISSLAHESKNHLSTGRSRRDLPVPLSLSVNLNVPIDQDDDIRPKPYRSDRGEANFIPFPLANIDVTSAIYLEAAILPTTDALDGMFAFLQLLGLGKVPNIFAHSPLHTAVAQSLAVPLSLEYDTLSSSPRPSPATNSSSTHAKLRTRSTTSSEHGLLASLPVQAHLAMLLAYYDKGELQNVLGFLLQLIAFRVPIPRLFRDIAVLTMAQIPSVFAANPTLLSMLSPLRRITLPTTSLTSSLLLDYSMYSSSTTTTPTIPALSTSLLPLYLPYRQSIFQTLSHPESYLLSRLAHSALYDLNCHHLWPDTPTLPGNPINPQDYTGSPMLVPAAIPREVAQRVMGNDVGEILTRKPEPRQGYRMSRLLGEIDDPASTKLSAAIALSEPSVNVSPLGGHGQHKSATSTDPLLTKTDAGMTLAGKGGLRRAQIPFGAHPPSWSTLAMDYLSDAKRLTRKAAVQEILESVLHDTHYGEGETLERGEEGAEGGEEVSGVMKGDKSWITVPLFQATPSSQPLSRTTSTSPSQLKGPEHHGQRDDSDLGADADVSDTNPPTNLATTMPGDERGGGELEIPDVRGTVAKGFSFVSVDVSRVFDESLRTKWQYSSDNRRHPVVKAVMDALELEAFDKNLFLPSLELKRVLLKVKEHVAGPLTSQIDPKLMRYVQRDSAYLNEMTGTRSLAKRKRLAMHGAQVVNLERRMRNLKTYQQEKHTRQSMANLKNMPFLYQGKKAINAMKRSDNVSPTEDEVTDGGLPQLKDKDKDQDTDNDTNKDKDKDTTLSGSADSSSRQTPSARLDSSVDSRSESGDTPAADNRQSSIPISSTSTLSPRDSVIPTQLTHTLTSLGPLSYFSWTGALKPSDWSILKLDSKLTTKSPLSDLVHSHADQTSRQTDVGSSTTKEENKQPKQGNKRHFVHVPALNHIAKRIIIPTDTMNGPSTSSTTHSLSFIQSNKKVNSPSDNAGMSPSLVSSSSTTTTTTSTSAPAPPPSSTSTLSLSSLPLETRLPRLLPLTLPPAFRLRITTSKFALRNALAVKGLLQFAPNSARRHKHRIRMNLNRVKQSEYEANVKNPNYSQYTYENGTIKRPTLTQQQKDAEALVRRELPLPLLGHPLIISMKTPKSQAKLALPYMGRGRLLKDSTHAATAIHGARQRTLEQAVRYRAYRSSLTVLRGKGPFASQLLARASVRSVEDWDKYSAIVEEDYLNAVSSLAKNQNVEDNSTSSGSQGGESQAGERPVSLPKVHPPLTISQVNPQEIVERVVVSTLRSVTTIADFPLTKTPGYINNLRHKRIPIPMIPESEQPHPIMSGMLRGAFKYVDPTKVWVYPPKTITRSKFQGKEEDNQARYLYTQKPKDRRVYTVPELTSPRLELQVANHELRERKKQMRIQARREKQAEAIEKERLRREKAEIEMRDIIEGRELIKRN